MRDPPPVVRYPARMGGGCAPGRGGGGEAPGLAWAQGLRRGSWDGRPLATPHGV